MCGKNLDCCTDDITLLRFTVCLVKVVQAGSRASCQTFHSRMEDHTPRFFVSTLKEEEVLLLCILESSEEDPLLSPRSSRVAPLP